MAATLVTLLDRGYFLPGSLSDLAHSGARGITTISAKHVSFPSRATLKVEYLGKNHTLWSKTIRTDDLVGQAMRANLKYYLAGKGEEELVFTLRDGRAFTGRMLNSYLRRISGEPGATATMFRRFHAGRLLRLGLRALQRSHIAHGDIRARILGRWVRGEYRPGILDEIAVELGHRRCKGRSWRALVAHSIDPAIWDETSGLRVDLSHLALLAR